MRTKVSTNTFVSYCPGIHCCPNHISCSVPGRPPVEEQSSRLSAFYGVSTAVRLLRIGRGVRFSAAIENSEIHMGSSLKGNRVTADSSRSIAFANADRRACWGGVSPVAEPAESYEETALNRVDRSIVCSAKKPPRILLVDEARALHELHLVLLRSIPACVETLSSCSDMYFHKEHAYALVILVPHPESKETAEAAQFVRHRWRTAKILLLESESPMIDDWLYDDRAEPHLHPATICGVASRLISQEEFWVPA